MASSLADDLARAVLGEPVLNSVEVAAGGGVSLDEARRLWRAMGFPPVPEDQRLFTAADAATLVAVRALVAQQVTAPEVLVQLTRVMGLSLSRIAEAQIAARADTAEID